VLNILTINSLRTSCIISLISVLAVFYSTAQPSVLATGKWYKVAIERNGVYRIDQSLFRKMGFAANSDPRKIKIYTHGSGMLPQANSAPRPVDLTEVAIFIQGEADGVFNAQDYILFYGQGPDYVKYNAAKDIFHYEKNLYTKFNYYFITVSDSPGKRVETGNDQGPGFPVINEFENFRHHEINQYNELKSGREWFGERFDITTDLTIRINADFILAESPIKLVTDVMAQSYGNTSFTISMNGVQIGQQNIAPIPNTQYGLKGRHALDTLQTTASIVGAATRSVQEIRYQYNKSPGVRSVGYLDYFLLQTVEQLRLKDQTIFRSGKSLQYPVSTFEIRQANGSTLVWDITNPVEPQFQNAGFNTASTTLSFSTSTTTLKEFIAFNPGAPAPELVGPVANQNIRGMTTPSLLIVTHPDFKHEAMRLKAHRESHSGLSAWVVTTEEVYNEFSGGKQDVTAIRDLAKFFYDKNPGTLKSVLLFGKCSYDYMDVIVDNKNFVPTYQSRNSLHPLQTYSSDDYFGFLENHEGEWRENPADAHTLDIGVGRIPVKSPTEAHNVVNKIIHYDTGPKLFNRWRKNITFVADDGDFNIHQSQADQMAEFIDQNFPMYNTRKIYLDAFPQIPGAGGQISPETKNQLVKTFNDGSLIINYTGHGSERLWAQERILDDLLIFNLKNERLPLLVTATCEFGRQDDPLLPSGGELSMLQPNGGAIGLVTTSRPVSSSTNFELNQAFYNAFFQQENGKNLSLGEIFRRTKNSSISGVSNRNFSLIGDPSMQLAMPEHDIRLSAIATSNESNVLKALSNVLVKGEVVDAQLNKIESFNGILEATLFDKKTSFVTLGNENPPFAYTQWFNALFRGKASVQNGSFEFEFAMPKNIAYAIDVGKLSLYAHSEADQTDASGFSKEFYIGSSEENVEADDTPPVINLFVGDPTFENGGITGPNTTLVARLYDESGINISGYGIGNSIIAVLDDDDFFILNDYYDADIDDYTRGTIRFNLNNLQPGKHTLTLRAWDTHNNPGQATIHFMVTHGTALVIENFANYPNPFNAATNIFFTHNQSGADLDAALAIYDYTGNLLKSYSFFITESTYQVNLVELTREDDFDKILKPGLYLARLVVRSLADGSKNERVTKLIIAN
jgi:hypothetical protein